MTKIEKNYIGKAKKNTKTEGIISVTLNMENAEAFIFEYEGKRYLKFEVAIRKDADKFGNTHTVYVNKRIKSEESIPETKTKSRKK